MKNKLLFFLLLIIILLPAVARAQAAPASTTTGFENICSPEKGLAVCVQQVYLFSLGAGTLLAFLMLILAGYKYMTAGGNASQVESAKEMFGDAFIGVIIIFVAFILLNLINPDLVRFRDPSKTLTLPAINTNVAAPELPVNTTRNTTTTGQSNTNLATQIIGSGIALSDSGDYPGYTARLNILEMSQGKYPSVCSPSNGCKPGGATGAVTVNSRILQAMLNLKSAGFNFTISSLTTGKHSATSKHYTGNAVDVIPAQADLNYWTTIRNALRRENGKDESAYCEKADGSKSESCAGADHIHWEL